MVPCEEVIESLNGCHERLPVGLQVHHREKGVLGQPWSKG